jgi:hypothetical protein
MGIDEIYKLANDSKEYRNHMEEVRFLGSEIMKLLGVNKNLLEKYERSMWLAEEFCVNLALNKGNQI